MSWCFGRGRSRGTEQMEYLKNIRSVLEERTANTIIHYELSNRVFHHSSPPPRDSLTLHQNMCGMLKGQEASRRWSKIKFRTRNATKIRIRRIMRGVKSYSKKRQERIVKSITKREGFLSDPSKRMLEERDDCTKWRKRSGIRHHHHQQARRRRKKERSRTESETWTEFWLLSSNPILLTSSSGTIFDLFSLSPSCFSFFFFHSIRGSAMNGCLPRRCLSLRRSVISSSWWWYHIPFNIFNTQEIKRMSEGKNRRHKEPSQETWA